MSFTKIFIDNDMYYFEMEFDYHGEIVDNRMYFEGMKIMSADDKVLARMEQYPVISLSLMAERL